jgi:hypothetical protein
MACCDLVVGVQEGGESSGRCSHGVVDLVQSTCVIGLVSEDFPGFSGDDFGSRALVLQGTCTKISRLL